MAPKDSDLRDAPDDPENVPVVDGAEGVELYHNELYRIARRELRRMARGQTIDTVALVNEAYLRVDPKDRRWSGRGHFLASMTTVMRHVLVDYARERGAQRRGGDWQQITMSKLEKMPALGDPVEILALDAAMTELGCMSRRTEQIVQLKIFGGLTGQEIADALEVSTATVARELRVATAFLSQKLAQ